MESPGLWVARRCPIVAEKVLTAHRIQHFSQCCSPSGVTFWDKITVGPPGVRAGPKQARVPAMMMWHVC